MKVDGSRLSRATTYGHAVIDLIAPAPASRALHSQPAGRFHVDKFPGIQNALNEPAVVVDVKAVPLEGSPYSPFRIAVPTITAALVIKALAPEPGKGTKKTSTGFSPPPTRRAPHCPHRHTTTSPSAVPPSTSTAASCRAHHSRHACSSTARSHARRSVPSSSTSDR